MKLFKGLSLIVILLTAIVLASSVYTVNERERALVFQFGEIVRDNIKPGLHFKVPLIQNVTYFDARIQTLDAEPESYFTAQQKNLVIDSFVKWRIIDTKEYYIRLGGNVNRARNRLSQRVNDAIREQVAKRPLNEVVSGDRAVIMDTVRQSMNEDAANLGIEVVDVRLKRVDLDESISEKVYDRMSAERKRIANDLRAKGEEQAERIKADADRQREIMIAEAVESSEQTKGNGDAEATKIYAEAYNKDKEFFKFYKSLKAYENTFKDKSDVFVISPNSEFMQYLDASKAK